MPSGALGKGGDASFKAGSLADSFEGADIERDTSREFQASPGNSGCMAWQGRGAGQRCAKALAHVRALPCLRQGICPPRCLQLVHPTGGPAHPPPLQGKETLRSDIGAGTWAHAGYHLATTIATPAACESAERHAMLQCRGDAALATLSDLAQCICCCRCTLLATTLVHDAYPLLQTPTCPLLLRRSPGGPAWSRC